MSVYTQGSPIKKLYGETASLTTTAAHLAFMPKYHEVSLYCASAWRLGIAPRLIHCLYYNGTTYTEYVQSVTDRSSSTHLPLDGMTTAHSLYLGFTEPVRGVYFDIGTNVQDEVAALDVEYSYDCADASYWKITGTITGALTVGETVTETTAADVATGVTATLVYSGATYIIVKAVSGGHPTLATGYDWDGATQSCNNVTAIAKSDVIPFFTDVANDSDGTKSVNDTLKTDGLYTWDLPSMVATQLGTPNAPVASKCYWIKITPSATLSTTVDIDEIIPACDTTNYAYMEGGIVYQFNLNEGQNGAFEFDHTATGTLDINWIMH